MKHFVSKNPLVSVIISSFNYDKYLYYSISSALNQTYKNIEVIVVDDGSTDNSKQVIEMFGNKIIKIYKNNGGQASALNHGFAKCAGEVIFFLDSDDIFYHNKVELILKLYRKHEHNYNYLMIYHLLDVIDAYNFSSGSTRPKQLFSENIDFYNYGKKYRFIPYFSAPTSGLSINKNLAEKCFPLPEVRVSPDAFLVYLAELIGKVIGMDQVLGGFRIHGENQHLIKFYQHKQYYILLNNFLNDKLKKVGKKSIISFFDSHYSFHYYYYFKDARNLFRIPIKLLKWRVDLRNIKWSFLSIFYGINILLKTLLRLEKKYSDNGLPF